MTNPYPITPRQLDLVSLSGSHLVEQGVYPNIKMGVIASYNVSSGSAETVLKSTASGGLTLASLNVQGNSTLRNVLPENTDTYDLGSSINLWRKGWLSELDTIIFAENTAALVGGWLIIGKDQGSLPSFVDSTDTTIDFGKTMVVGGSVVLRSSLQVEYIATGSLASGSTVYNVVRDLDGTGSNDWVEGSVFLALGESGDGRIELNAYDTPRIQLIQQGEAYNQQKEIIRIGDLNGNWNYSAEEWGVAIGSYGSGSANITIDPTNGIRLRIHDTSYIALQNDGNAKISGKLQLDGTSSALSIGAIPPTSASAGTGIWLDKTGLFTLNANNVQIKIDATTGIFYAADEGLTIDDNGISFWGSGMNSDTVVMRWWDDYSGDNLLGGMYCDWGGGGAVTAILSRGSADTPWTDNSVILNAYNATNDVWLSVNAHDNTVVVNQDFVVQGDYQTYKNSTGYTGYLFVPLTAALTSTSWDGDSFSTTSKTLIDLSSVFSAPAGIKAILVAVSVRDSASQTSDTVLTLSPNNTSGVGMRFSPQYTNDRYGRYSGIVPCDANGDIYYQIDASGAGTFDVVLQIWGYWI